MIDLATLSQSQRVFDAEAQYLAPGTQSVALFSKLCMDRGEGAVLWDVDGNRYVDLLAGVGVASLGYAHPRYVAEMSRQLERVHVGSFTSEHRAALVKLIAELAPGDLNRTQLYSSGAEAVEAAVRLAKAATGRHEMMGFWGGFHGKTGGVLPLLSGSFKHGLGPLAPGNYSTPYASCARCAFAKPWANPSGSSSSYGGNPLAAAAAHVTIRTIVEEGLVEHSRRLGALMLAEMQRWEDELPIVSDVRGRGLMIGMDLVVPGTRRLVDKKTARWIFDTLLSRGVLAMIYNPEVRINPPLVIDEDQAMGALAIMKDVLGEAAERLVA